MSLSPEMERDLRAIQEEFPYALEDFLKTAFRERNGFGEGFLIFSSFFPRV